VIKKKFFYQPYQDFGSNDMILLSLMFPITILFMDSIQNSARDVGRDVIHNRAPPRPILPVNLTGAVGLVDLNPEEVARQLTLIEYDLYKAIKPWECLNQAWTKKNKEEKAPNILAVIKRFNRVRNSFFFFFSLFPSSFFLLKEFSKD
jgi:hypothetical protein